MLKYSYQICYQNDNLTVKNAVWKVLRIYFLFARNFDSLCRTNFVYSGTPDHIRFACKQKASFFAVPNRNLETSAGATLSFWFTTVRIVVEGNQQLTALFAFGNRISFSVQKYLPFASRQGNRRGELHELSTMFGTPRRCIIPCFIRAHGIEGLPYGSPRITDVILRCDNLSRFVRAHVDSLRWSSYGQDIP